MNWFNFDFNLILLIYYNIMFIAFTFIFGVNLFCYPLYMSQNLCPMYLIILNGKVVASVLENRD
jgi:hypothetical protein